MTKFIAIGWPTQNWDYDFSFFSHWEEFHSKFLVSSSPLTPSDQETLSPSLFFLYVLKCPETSNELKTQLKALETHCLGLSPDQKNNFQIFLIGAEKLKPDALVPILNRFPVAAAISSEEIIRVPDFLNAFVLTQRFEEQKKALEELRSEEELKNEFQYQKMMNELNEQQKKLNDLQRRLLYRLQQEKILHDVLMAIMTTQSLAELELELQNVLEPLLGASQIRFILHPGSTHPHTQRPSTLIFALHERDQLLGQWLISPLETKSLSPNRIKLLENISEVLALHIPRFLASEELKNLQQEWTSTFDSIKDPLILVNEQYEILESNRAARDRRTAEAHSGPYCHEQLFGFATPCSFCPRGKQRTQLSPPLFEKEIWEVTSQKLMGQSSREPLYIHHYRNVFAQKELEEGIKKNAQAAEVGIFKASLAHELNNPVGGLLTLAQLQKMELPLEHPYRPMIDNIESLAKSCRDIIQNLLQKSK